MIGAQDGFLERQLAEQQLAIMTILAFGTLYLGEAPNGTPNLGMLRAERLLADR